VIVNSVFLLSSSGTITLALRSMRGERTRSFLVWMLATILLGSLFIAGTGYEWYRLIYHDGLTIGTNLFGTTFFTLIGFHAAHVTIGLLMMSVLVPLVGSRRVQAASQAPELVSWYWHFVDGVWVVIFAVVYVLGRT
jgi:cytochrome c oxidase subunit 3/cytochrome o ubiquinol oxidase subunit 3